MHSCIKFEVSLFFCLRRFSEEGTLRPHAKCKICMRPQKHWREQGPSAEISCVDWNVSMFTVPSFITKPNIKRSLLIQ
jgi:hypothetical protein